LVISIVLVLIRFTRWTNTMSHMMLTTKKSTTPASTNHGHRKVRFGGPELCSSIMGPAIGRAEWQEE